MLFSNETLHLHISHLMLWTRILFIFIELFDLTNWLGQIVTLFTYAINRLID